MMPLNVLLCVSHTSVMTLFIELSVKTDKKKRRACSWLSASFFNKNIFIHKKPHELKNIKIFFQNIVKHLMQNTILIIPTVKHLMISFKQKLHF